MRRGRGYLDFCEQHETKSLVTRDREPYPHNKNKDVGFSKADIFVFVPSEGSSPQNRGVLFRRSRLIKHLAFFGCLSHLYLQVANINMLRVFDSLRKARRRLALRAQNNKTLCKGFYYFVPSEGIEPPSSVPKTGTLSVEL